MMLRSVASIQPCSEEFGGNTTRSHLASVVRPSISTSLLFGSVPRTGVRAPGAERTDVTLFVVPETPDAVAVLLVAPAVLLLTGDTTTAGVRTFESPRTLSAMTSTAAVTLRSPTTARPARKNGCFRTAALVSALGNHFMRGSQPPQSRLRQPGAL